MILYDFIMIIVYGTLRLMDRHCHASPLSLWFRYMILPALGTCRGVDESSMAEKQGGRHDHMPFFFFYGETMEVSMVNYG